MAIKLLPWLLLLPLLNACQAKPERSPLATPADWTLPYGKWGFAFFTPKLLPATVTHVRIVDTEGYRSQFTMLDSTQDNPYSIGKWYDKVKRGTHFNQAIYPPQYMLFCWDSIIDKKTYQTEIFFGEPVWKKMKNPAAYKDMFGETVWFKTMLFGLAPEGKVRIWLQDDGRQPNYPVPVIKQQTFSDDKLDFCKGITRHSKGYGYTQTTQDFIKGKTYPYGNW
ncbi:MAG: DUF2931 family protein [Rouxiella aceris]|uniref:DUF2931 family protein n=1 Tax=Rouxiella aceris TaxID=2703884 RepID=UPI002846B177|nr:DUF2931 family protein [Rouxiella aceris]MDR3433336.1 DUF2931 family protein [Rouxiella aceris]